MASGSSPDSALSRRISKNHLECSICTECYKDPKILECLHSFCEKCLKRYATGQHPNRPKIPCPLCRQETTLPREGVSGLKTNFFITSLMEDITLQEKIADSTHRLMCDICGKTNEATHHCFNCSNNLCATCAQMHQRFRDLASHTLATFEDIQQGRVEVTKRRGIPSCEKHRGEVKQFFCEKCQVLICRDCTVVDHPSNKGHCVVDATTAAQKRKQSLRQYLDMVFKNTTALQDSVKKALQDKTKIEENAQQVLKEIHNAAEALRSKVTEEENRLFKSFQDLQDRKQKTIDDLEEKVNARIKRNKHSAEIAQDIMTKATDSDFLSLYPEVSKDLESLCSVPAANLHNSSDIQWVRNTGNQTINLGKLMISNPGTMARHVYLQQVPVAGFPYPRVLDYD